MVFHACVVSPHFCHALREAKLICIFFFALFCISFFCFVLFVTLTNSTRLAFVSIWSSAFRTILAFYPCGFFVSLSFFLFFFLRLLTTSLPGKSPPLPRIVTLNAFPVSTRRPVYPAGDEEAESDEVYKT